MATDKVQTGLRLKEPVYEKMKVLAHRQQRSFNNFMEFVIQEYIDNYEAEHGPIQIPEQDSYSSLQ